MKWKLSLVFSLATLLSVVLASSVLAHPDHAANKSGQTPIEIRGLQPQPEMPVASISLRPGQEAHHRDFSLPRPPKQPACDKDIGTTSVIFGVSFVAAQDNRICTTADIDVYTSVVDSHTHHYIVQAGGQEAAWTHTGVTNPANPALLGQFTWSGRGGKNTYTPDVKAFKQGTKNYIAMGLERTAPSGYCGVVIADVTDPTSPTVVKQFIGSNWCDTHNVFVENDGSGNGAYIYATANTTNDMRVLDIGGGGGSVGSPVEVGRYTAPTANNDNYVHDITVIDHGGSIGRRAYLSYWDSGLVVLNASDVTPGTNPTPLVGPNVIDPANFLTHHAYPNAAGTRVFIEDEITYSPGFEPVQMWDISSTTNPSYVDGIAADVGKGGELLPAHNLHVEGNTLYVGWYKAGLQAFDFSDTGIGSRRAYHQVQTERTDDVYDGAWGVRLLEIGGEKYVFQSDRRYGLIIDRLLP